MTGRRPKGIGPARGGFVGTDADPTPKDWKPDAEWTFLPGGWVEFPHPDYPGHRVSVLADTRDPERPRLVGVRIEPLPTEGGEPRADTPTLTSLRGLSVRALAEVARAANALDLRALPSAYREARGETRKPYRGSAEHREAVLAVVADAQRRGQTPARALMAAFKISRPTAYEWLRAYTEEASE